MSKDVYFFIQYALVIEIKRFLIEYNDEQNDHDEMFSKGTDTVKPFPSVSEWKHM